MCIAILQTEGTSLTRRELKNCWNNNDDGAGIAWVENGSISVYKEINSFRKFYKSYRKILAKHGNNSKMLVHFRWATHGLVDEENCHPHMVHKDLAFIHNGIIDIDANSTKSDTMVFNEKVLQHLPLNFIHRKKTMAHVERRAGSSILIFLDSGNVAKIIGEELGIWYNGRWFSNRDYLYAWKDSLSQYGTTYRAVNSATWEGDDDTSDEVRMAICDDDWERYEMEHYGKREIDYSSDSMQTGVRKWYKKTNKRLSNAIRGLCFRCGVFSESLKMMSNHWHCQECVGDLTRSLAVEATNVEGGCHECGCYDEDLVSFNNEWYCRNCFKLFTV